MNRLILILATLVLLTGCCGEGYVRVEGIQVPLDKVMSRHDAYVNSDETLAPLQKRIYLRSTFVLRKTLADAKDPGSTQ